MELVSHKVVNVPEFCLPHFHMANERRDGIWGQGHALGISTGYLPTIIMAELHGKGDCSSPMYCHVFVF